MKAVVLFACLAGAALAPIAGCSTESATTPPIVEPVPEPDPEPETKEQASLALNDVSVLMPLPASPAAPGYLSPLNQGERGELLPRSIYDQIPDFPVVPSQGLDYDRMRVLAVRFDGCHLVPEGCVPQIRMVMQPVTDDGSTLDSALHLFYELEEGQMAAVVDELRRLHALAPEVEGAPLDVHPALVAQGMEGAYAQGLGALLLRYTGEENLTRMTFFLRAPPQNEVWFFGGFDRVDGDLQVMDIVGVGENNQRVILTEVDDGWDYDLTPVALFPEDGSTLFTSAAADAATSEDIDAAFASFLRVENPTIYSPDDLPCAGCHISAFVTSQARARFGMETSSFAEDVYASDRDLTMRGGAAEEDSSLRAFGYFDDRAMIAQRTVNESAMVLDDLETRFPARAIPAD